MRPEADRDDEVALKRGVLYAFDDLLEAAMFSVLAEIQREMDRYEETNQRPKPE